jgi:hypothetical protein
MKYYFERYKFNGSFYQKLETYYFNTKDEAEKLRNMNLSLDIKCYDIKVKD